MKLFFDLEDTLITTFDNPRIINTSKIIKFNSDLPVEVGIFSFAIWNETHRLHFNSYIKPMIEDAFNIIVIDVPTMDEMVTALKTKWVVIEDIYDLFDFFDKERAFIEYCQIMFPEQSCILVDDRVNNVLYTIGTDIKTEIRTVNVNDL